MNYRVGLVLVVMLFVVPISALALVTCRDTNKGCTLEQLTQLNKDAGALGLAISDRISILQEIIGKLTAQITVLQSGGGTNVSNTACLDLKYGLVIGSTDAATGGEVSKLQKFLLDNGYGDPDGDSGFLLQRATGYYGAQTATAVVKWQKAHGMDFVTTKSGVGPMTRAKLKCVGDTYGLSARIDMIGAVPVAVAEFHGKFDVGAVGMDSPKAYIDFGDGASRAVEKTVCPGDDCYFRATHLYRSSGTYTITLHTVANAKRVNLATTNLVVTKGACPNNDTPFIASISPISGPRGTEVEIWGCNLSGFEGDTDFIFAPTAGQRIVIDGEGSYARSGASRAVIKIEEPCKAGETVYGEYSGLPSPCVFTPFTPGTYEVFVGPWSKKSNVVRFTVTP